MSDIFSKKRSYDYAPHQKIDAEKAQTYDKGFWESYRDSRDFQTYAGNSYSREDNLHDEYEKEIENIKNISAEFKEKNNHIPWGKIMGFRNGIVHEYGETDYTIVYETATEDLDELRILFESIL